MNVKSKLLFQQSRDLRAEKSQTELLLQKKNLIKKNN